MDRTDSGAMGFPITLGRRLTPPRKVARPAVTGVGPEVAYRRLMGRPIRMLLMPLICHPPSTASTTVGALFIHLRDFPTGRFQTALVTFTTGMLYPEIPRSA